MANTTFRPSTTWDYANGSQNYIGKSTFHLGKSSTTTYYAVIEFDLAETLAGKNIKSAKFYVKGNGGNSSDCPTGCGIIKARAGYLIPTVSDCQDVGASPAGTNTITKTGTDYVEFDVTRDAAVLQESGTSFVVLAHTSSSANHYKELHGSGADESNQPYMVVETQDGTVRVYTGGNWVACEASVRKGGAFVKCEVKARNGGIWKECGV